MFESGNLLQAERSPTNQDSYNLYMQVDTNTRGHQQWFYFRVKGGIKGKTYTFNIMNFTKPGVTGGRGYKNSQHSLRIVARSKKKTMNSNNDFNEWENIFNEDENCQYIKTNVARRKKDVLAAGADSDQEDWVEEAFNQPNVVNQNAGINDKAQFPLIDLNGPPDPNNKQSIPNSDGASPLKEGAKPKKRRTFYYYALKFTYKFEHDDDSVHIAFSQPYSYTEILNDIHSREMYLAPKSANDKKIVGKNKSDNKLFENEKLEANPIPTKQQCLQNLRQNQFQKNITIENSQKLIYYQREEFCRTITGIPLYKIIIARDQRCLRRNKIVLITARVHSGETPASHVFKAIIEFITSDRQEAKYLRRFYTFILIPCMNPDGVICGNYRNSLAGVDLNRQWINPEPQFHPEVYHVKQLMQSIKEEDKRQIWIFCDLHGHSKKRNSFFYGCNTAANGGFLSWTIVRLLPRIFAQKTHMFSYKNCKFKVEPYKIGTARIVAWKQFAITHSFTLENSFFGFDIGEDENQVFQLMDYYTVGTKFVLAIYEMHYMWKQIQRELQITNGWLKPRTLNEMTGVPAAQILAQEAAQIKEEERKKKAIEQYETYLKKFYKGIGANFQLQSRQRTNIVKLAHNTETNMNDLKDQHLQENKMRLETPDKKQGYETEKKSRNATRISNNFSENVQKNEKLPVTNQNKKNQLDIESKGDKNEQNKESGVLDEESCELPTEGQSDKMEFMFKMHQGLVKIQALVRGYLQRNKFKKDMIKKQNKLINRQINRNSGITRQRSNQLIQNSSGKKLKIGRINAPSQMEVLYDTSSDGGFKTAAGTTQVNNLDSSNDNEDKLIRSNTEQIQVKNLSDSNTTTKSQVSREIGSILQNMNFGQQNSLKPRLDWREYFKEDELDKAYQIVEVEQRDETDNDSNSGSMGSNSNPSEDNFDEEEMYRNVYKVKNPEVILETRKIKEQEFIDKVQKETKSQSDIIVSLTHTKKYLNNHTDSRKDKLDIASINNQKKLAYNSIQDNDNYYKDKSLQRKQSNSTYLNKQKDEESENCTPIGNERTNKMSDQDFSAQVLNEIANINHQQDSGNNSPQASNKQQVDNIFQNINHVQKRVSKSSNQQRSLIQPQNQYQSTMNLSNKISLAQKTFKIQHNYHQKRENINQVIKDCFITKKMATKKVPNNIVNSKRSQQTTNQANQNSSVQAIKQSGINSQKIYKNKQNKINLKLNQAVNQLNVNNRAPQINQYIQRQFKEDNGQQQQFLSPPMSNTQYYIKDALQNSQLNQYQLQQQNIILLQNIVQNSNNPLQLQHIMNNMPMNLNLQRNEQIQQTVPVQNAQGHNSSTQQPQGNNLNSTLFQLHQQMNGMSSLQLNQFLQSIIKQHNKTNVQQIDPYQQPQTNYYGQQFHTDDNQQKINLATNQFYPVYKQDGENENENFMMQSYHNQPISYQQQQYDFQAYPVDEQMIKEAQQQSQNPNNNEPTLKRQYRYQSSKQIENRSTNQHEYYSHSAHKVKQTSNSIETHQKHQPMILNSADKNSLIFNKNNDPQFQQQYEQQNTFQIDQNGQIINQQFNLQQNSYQNQQFHLGNDKQEPNLGQSLFLKYVKKKVSQQQKYQLDMQKQFLQTQNGFQHNRHNQHLLQPIRHLNNREDSSQTQNYFSQDQGDSDNLNRSQYKDAKIAQQLEINDIYQMKQLLQQQQQNYHSSGYINQQAYNQNLSTKNNNQQYQIFPPTDDISYQNLNISQKLNGDAKNVMRSRINSATNSLKNQQIPCKNPQQSQKNNKIVLNQEIINIKELIHEIQQIRSNQQKQVLMQQRYKTRCKTKQR